MDFKLMRKVNILHQVTFQSNRNECSESTGSHEHREQKRILKLPRYRGVKGLPTFWTTLLNVQYLHIMVGHQIALLPVG